MTSTATVRAPEATADAMPDGESSTATQSRDVDAEQRGAASRYGSGSGFGARDLVTADDDVEQAGGRGERLREHARTTT